MANTNIKIDDINANSDYWKERWSKNEIEFHQSRTHPMLVKHFDRLVDSKENIKIFIPLCGKTLDLIWLASKGYKAVGIELSTEACEQFFSENNIKHTVTDIDDFRLFASEDGNIKIYNGDFFKFTTKYESQFECIWDRGSLVALPQELRIGYAKHVLNLLQPNFRYLLDAFKYNPELYGGPPFLVSEDELNKHYGDVCKIELIDTNSGRSFNDKLVGDETPKELVYLITKK